MPHETLLVADSLTGQDAVNLARTFNERIGISGIVLTRIDGDGRGGAALSMRAVTGKPIKLLGTSEKLDGIEDFHPERIAGRILGMGDVVSLVEKAAETIDQQKAEAMAKKMVKGEFDLEDLAEQLRQMQKIGGMSSVLGFLPGIGKIKKQIDAANLDDKILKRQGAIISSMTPKERKSPLILKASRKKRIAAGSGTTVQEVNTAFEDAPPDGRHDEVHRQGQGRARQDVRHGRRRQDARAHARNDRGGEGGPAPARHETAGRLRRWRFRWRRLAGPSRRARFPRRPSRIAREEEVMIIKLFHDAARLTQFLLDHLQMLADQALMNCAKFTSSIRRLECLDKSCYQTLGRR